MKKQTAAIIILLFLSSCSDSDNNQIASGAGQSNENSTANSTMSDNFETIVRPKSKCIINNIVRSPKSGTIDYSKGETLKISIDFNVISEMDDARAVVYISDDEGNDNARGFSKEIFNSVLKPGRYITEITIDHGIDNPFATDNYVYMYATIGGGNEESCSARYMNVNYNIII